MSATVKSIRKGIRLADDLPAPSIPSSAQSSVLLPVSAIVALDEVQMRAGCLQADYLDDLTDLYSTGSPVPPVEVFVDGAVDSFAYYLADGFHRLAAAKRAGTPHIHAYLHEGTRREAIRFALSANATHGKRRTNADLNNAYRAAVVHGFCAADDVKAVVVLLKCSERWARAITQPAREAIKAARDEEIERLAEAGKTQEEISQQVGVAQRTVSNRLQQKRKASEIAKPISLELSPPDFASAAFNAAKRNYLSLGYVEAVRFRDWLALQALPAAPGQEADS